MFEEVRSKILKNNFLKEKFTDVVKESSSTCLSQDTVSSCCDILYKKCITAWLTGSGRTFWKGSILRRKCHTESRSKCQRERTKIKLQLIAVKALLKKKYKKLGEKKML